MPYMMFCFRLYIPPFFTYVFYTYALHTYSLFATKQAWKAQQRSPKWRLDYFHLHSLYEIILAKSSTSEIPSHSFSFLLVLLCFLCNPQWHTKRNVCYVDPDFQFYRFLNFIFSSIFMFPLLFLFPYKPNCVRVVVHGIRVGL